MLLPHYLSREQLPVTQKLAIRKVDSGRKKSKTASLLSSPTVSSIMSPQALEAPPPEGSGILGDLSTLPCNAITTSLLEQQSRIHLRGGRVIIKDRSPAEKKESVRSFQIERNKVQWLPTCCICQEKRISDGSDIKSEISIPRSGHIKDRYPGQSVCARCKNEKLAIKKKGKAAIHAYSIDANMNPGNVPQVLARLSKVEVLAISRVHMLSQVIQLSYGVYGYRGNSIYLMNNVLQMCNTMPRKLDDLSHVWLRLLFPESTFLHHDYLVRRQYVLDAFMFLTSNWEDIPACRPAGCNLTRNPAYADLSMSNFSQDILDTYPEHGVPDQFTQSITQKELDLVEEIINKVDTHAYYPFIITNYYYYLILLFSALFFLKNNWKNELMILIIITSVVSFFLAGYHVGIEYGLINELSSCKTEVGKNISKDILLKELQSKLAPSCKEVGFKLFGLSLASINMIMSLILTILYYKIFSWTKKTSK